MNVIVKDEQGLGTVLMMDGFSQKEILGIKESIRQQIKDAAVIVFKKVLGKELPENIIVVLAQNDNDELEGKKSALLGSFNSALSSPSSLRFTICEKTIKDLLRDYESELYASTLIHEMFHAADLSVLSATDDLAEGIMKEIYSSYEDPFPNHNVAPLVTYLGLIKMLDHYRAEGVAILGEALLTKRRFGEIMDAVSLFRFVFAITMEKSKSDVLRMSPDDDGFDEFSHDAAYGVAPFVLLLVLEKLGKIDESLKIKALEGLCAGHYELTEQEVSCIMQQTQSLTLQDYIQGLLALGNKIAPIKPFLEFCALLQGDYDADNIDSFATLLRQPQVTSKDFDKAIGEIMGAPFDDAELDEAFQEFCDNPPDETRYPGLKEKVNNLYSLLKSNVSPEKQRIIRWALTYFFDDEDVIHDTIEGVGLVDDALVIDYAMKLMS